MATFTVSVPKELKKEMDEFPEINWPEYLKQRLKIRLEEFKKMKRNQVDKRYIKRGQ